MLLHWDTCNQDIGMSAAAARRECFEAAHVVYLITRSLEVECALECVPSRPTRARRVARPRIWGPAGRPAAGSERARTANKAAVVAARCAHSSLKRPCRNSKHANRQLESVASRIGVDEALGDRCFATITLVALALQPRTADAHRPIHNNLATPTIRKRKLATCGLPAAACCRLLACCCHMLLPCRGQSWMGACARACTTTSRMCVVVGATSADAAHTLHAYSGAAPAPRALRPCAPPQAAGCRTQRCSALRRRTSSEQTQRGGEASTYSTPSTPMRRAQRMQACTARPQRRTVGGGDRLCAGALHLADRV